LYISDFHGDPLVTEFDVENSQTVSKGIIKGTGPGDALPPLNLFLSGDTLFLINRRTFSIGYDIPNTHELSFHKLCSFPSDVSNLTGIDGKYLTAGYFAGGRYAVFNSHGEKESEFGDYPSFLAGEESFPVSAKAMYHQVRFAVNCNLHKVACVGSHVLDLVKLSPSASVVRRILLDSYDYRFTNGNAVSVNRTDDTSIGAKSVSSTDKYIYILFYPAANSSTESDLDPANEIWCFDWNGEPVKKFRVNQAIVELEAVNDSVFYAMSYPEYKLVKLNFAQNENDY
jgi:hypothetical protein